MNKSKTAIAIFAVMTAVSVTKAEDTTLNFDGHGQTKSFAAILAETPAAEVPTVAKASNIDSNNAQEKVFLKLEKGNQLALSAAVINGNPFGTDIMMLIGDPKTDILYNNDSAYFVSKDGNAYITVAESTDKRFISLLHKANTPALQNKNAIACKFVEMVLWELVKGVWTQVIRQVKECYTEPDTTPSTPANSGSQGPLIWPERTSGLQ